MQKITHYLPIICLSIIARADVFDTMYEPKDNAPTPSRKSLTQGFYREFWEINPSTNFDKLIYTPTMQQDFYKNIMLKTITGYGIRGFANNQANKIDPLKHLQDKFSNGSQDKLYDDLRRIKSYIMQVEQCYANMEGNDRYIENQHGERKQTKLEQEIESQCSHLNIKDLIDKILAIKTTNTSAINFKSIYSQNYNDSAATLPLTKQAKVELPIIHRMLQDVYRAKRAQLIRNLNKEFIDSYELESSDFIDADRLSDKNQINNIFDAFTDVVNFDSDNLPVNIFSADSGDILHNGSIKFQYELSNEFGDESVESIKNYRQSKSEELKKSRKEALQLAKSFGILKQAAVSGLTTIINERYAEGSDASKLSAINAEINTNLKISKGGKVRPTELLKQIRDNISLNNKLAYMRYIALEKNQLALTSVQIAQLKNLADKINEQFEAMNRAAVMIDAGDDLTHEVGAKPDVTEIK